jgi:hypothetical protein
MIFYGYSYFEKKIGMFYSLNNICTDLQISDGIYFNIVWA